jgi:hypothetical protein
MKRTIERYVGMCDASAALPLTPETFLAANDEDNILRCYSNVRPGAPLWEIDLADQFASVPAREEEKEIDLEGGALLGGVAYWITSHGRNKNGEVKRKRRQFLALTLATDDAGALTGWRAVGVHRSLLEDMQGDERLKKYRLGEAAVSPEAEGGFNIEGLATTPAGTLLIGLRNPLVGRNKRALVIPLLNAYELVTENDATAKFGPPIELDLGGRGVRSLEYWPDRNEYLIVAGARDDRKDAALFEWSGKSADAPRRLAVDLGDLNPEAVLIYLDATPNAVQILSDDGGRLVDGRECKRLEEEKRSFRGAFVTLP